ncbi:MAG: biopolymer transporter ExbD, partial [Pseudomonadota bacterium]
MPRADYFAGDAEPAPIIAGINVTPLVDITLVLLIIFMVTASYIVSPSIKVDLPQAGSGG